MTPDHDAGTQHPPSRAIVREHLAPLVDRLTEWPAVRAVAVVGSHASGVATAASDIDVFVYVDVTLHDELLAARERLADELAEPRQTRILSQPAFPHTDVWMPRGTNVWLDLMFWTWSWADGELDRCLDMHAAQTGYSTAHWRSIRDAIALFDRDGWHRRLQARARSAYPARLRRRIIALNRSVLDPNDPFSYVNQAAAAVDPGDLVAVNHRTAAWLASYFDVLFAVNRVLHPGEKRLVAFAMRECEVLPPDFATDVDDVLRLTCAPDIRLVDRMTSMLQRLDEVIDAAR